ncbi:MAG: ABC transporter permease [Bacillota bacterium]|nr:ABC transporter permease [Bacillota bacterium]
MWRFFLRRVGYTIIALYLLVTAIFFLFRLLPADPTATIVDPAMPPETIAALRETFGLDQPPHVQYFMYMRNMLRGDFGSSFYYRRPAFDVLRDKVANTLVLAAAALIVSYGIGVLLGALLAWWRGRGVEIAGIVLSLFFRSAPEFWIAMLAVMLFSYHLGWLPHAGIASPGSQVYGLARFFTLDFLRHLALPLLVSSLYQLANPLLLMRNTMLDVMGEDFVDMARAKGLPPKDVIYRHAARNALLPVVTALALYIGRAVGGMVVIEYVFGWPGLGREILLAANRYDYPVAQAAFTLIAALVSVMNLVADLVYSYLDPRIAYK